MSADYLFGSGLRKDGAVPCGLSLPPYFQLNLNVSHDFHFASFAGKLHTKLALINALDRTYQLRDGTGIGVGAPQFGPRRGVYRFNRRFRLHEMLPRLAPAVMLCKPHAETVLRMASNFHG